MNIGRNLSFTLVAILIATWSYASATEAVPNTLPEAFVVLDQRLPATERTKFQTMSEQEAVSQAHFGLGMHIRNEWFRAGGSTLPNSLHVRHLDDASSIILTSYWRHLNGKPLEVEQQANCYRRWWDEQDKLVDAAKTKGASNHGTPAFSCP